MIAELLRYVALGGCVYVNAWAVAFLYELGLQRWGEWRRRRLR